MLKIGIFDSGIGGLTVVKSITRVIKGADIFYIADTKNAPYGEKTPKQILEYSLNISRHLIENHNIDALIIACNTATAFAISAIREKYPSIIIIGTEPGIKPAIEATSIGKIGVLATPATLSGDKYQTLCSKLSYKKDIEFFEQACHGLVEQIEKGEINTVKTRELLKSWLLPMSKSGVDTIVLGCTHYPLVEEVIQNIMKNRVEIIHTGDAIANYLLLLTEKKGHINSGNLSLFIYKTGDIKKEMILKILY